MLYIYGVLDVALVVCTDQSVAELLLDPLIAELICQKLQAALIFFYHSVSFGMMLKAKTCVLILQKKPANLSDALGNLMLFRHRK